MADNLTDPWTQRHRIACVLLALLVMATTSLRAQTKENPELQKKAPAFGTGTPLTDALRQLQQSGINLVFSTGVVTPEMRVKSTTKAVLLREILTELLAPHGLDVTEGPGGALIVVAGRQVPPTTGEIHGVVRSSTTLSPMPGVSITALENRALAVTDSDGTFILPGLKSGKHTIEVRAAGFAAARERNIIVIAGRTSHVSFVLQPLLAEEIVVQPSRISLLVDDPSSQVSLSREEIDALPHLGDDVFRTLGLLPGTTTDDISAQPSIRGSRPDELLILLDGQELYEPYHLRDFDNALSIVGASALARVYLMTAAFPVSYGDRMAGVLSMVSVSPPAQRRLRLTASLVGAQIDAADTYMNGRLGWVASLRRGSTDLLGKAFNSEDPRFWDIFGKLHYQLTPRQSVQIHTLASRDDLQFNDPKESKHFDTDYHASYIWLTHRALLGKDLFVDTTISGTRAGRDRRGEELDDERVFNVLDKRNLDVTGLVQSWNFQAAEQHFVNAGVEYQRFVADYEYDSFREFDTPLAVLRSEPRDGSFALDQRFASEHLSLYASDRVRATDALTLDIGIRYDRHTQLDDNQINPRLTASWRMGEASIVRAGWGFFSQTHRAYELMVEDGDPNFYRAERSEHLVLGFEHLFPSDGRLPLASLRAEAYRRKVGNPRPRYDHLFKPFDPFPEGEIDRIRLEPESATAQGIELLLRGRSMGRFDWWLNYALASTTDRIDGRDVPRRVDQTHAMNIDVNYRINPRFNLNLAWLYHTGWPLTPLRFEEGAGGQLVPVAGPLNSERVPDYHRLDLRASRDWKVRHGILSVFVDGHNLYARENVAGRDVNLADPAGEPLIDERYPGFYASVGVAFEFGSKP